MEFHNFRTAKIAHFELKSLTFRISRTVKNVFLAETANISHFLHCENNPFLAEIAHISQFSHCKNSLNLSEMDGISQFSHCENSLISPEIADISQFLHCKNSPIWRKQIVIDFFSRRKIFRHFFLARKFVP